MKRKVFNQTGVIIYLSILMIAIFLGAGDTNNMTIFLYSKIIAFLLLYILYRLRVYLPQKYFDI